jgi:hypothetical protein
MSHRLRIGRVRSAARLNDALVPGEADEYGTLEGTTLIVDDQSDAATLVDRHHNVAWADTDEPSPERPSPTRANVGTDGASYECGVNDCSREVADPDDTCWQHDGD